MRLLLCLPRLSPISKLKCDSEALRPETLATHEFQRIDLMRRRSVGGATTRYWKLTASLGPHPKIFAEGRVTTRSLGLLHYVQIEPGCTRP